MEESILLTCLDLYDVTSLVDSDTRNIWFALKLFFNDKEKYHEGNVLIKKIEELNKKKINVKVYKQEKFIKIKFI